MRGITVRFAVTFALALPAFFAATASAADMVPWVDDFQTAQQMAAARNQLILVHFYSDNCPPCRRLEKNVFNRPGFGHGVAQNYVPVRVNVSVSPDLARKFNVDRWPTDLLLTPRGEEVHRMVSPQDINEYLRILNQVAWRVNSLSPGTPIQVATQGFQSDRYPAASMASSGASPYQFVSQPANTHSNGTFAAANQAVPQYDFGNANAGITAGPTMMNPVMNTQAVTNQVATNPLAATPGGTPPSVNQTPFAATGMPATSPEATIAEAQRQIALAQQQIAMAQRQAVHPQMIENQFASPPFSTSPPASSPPASSPPASSPLNVPPATTPQQSLNVASSGAPRAGFSPPTDATSQFTSGPSLSAPALSAPFTSATSAASMPSVPQAAAPPQRPQPPTTETQTVREFGLEGYCPVTLVDEDRWVKGDKRWGARHRGRLYLFQSAAAQQKFLAAPDQYSPALAGFDPVVFSERGQYAEGLRNHGIRYQDQVYLFVSEESLAQFAEAPTRYTQIVRQAIGANRQMR